MLADELATTWLLVESGRAGETVVVRRFCRACVPAGPVAEVACAVCADGPLLAGELANGPGRRRADAWLVGQGWHSGDTAGGTAGGTVGDGVVLCPRCAPVASSAAAVPGSGSDPVSDPPDAGGDGEWTLW